MKDWPRDRYTGSGGGRYNGSCENTYHSILSPDNVLIDYLRKTNQRSILELLVRVGYFN
ncbi:hypothetical protein [Clostridium isatidis]|uniref:hypothetical protein n=1 Tax=Clostridium isatidis TaxID=182773 RepID=UPI003AAC57A0